MNNETPSSSLRRSGERPGRSHHLWKLLALFLALSMVAAACGDSDEEESGTEESGDSTEESGDADEGGGDGDEEATGDGEPVTIEWWHIQNVDPMLGVWEEIATEFEEEHPNVTIEINAMENEAFKSALQVNLQAGDVPDLFQSWGGGGLKEQVDAGLVQDVTELSSGFIDQLRPTAAETFQVDGAQYGIPFNQGMVGFWYNKALFAEAGVDEPPTTWEELLEVVGQLKDAGITPIAVGAGDKWPAHFYYAYLMLRIGGPDAMEQAADDGDFNVPAFIEAGEEIQRLVEMEPFQPGFLATPWDGADGEAGFMGSGQAAMDLMGQWAPGAFENSSPDGEGLGDDLGWFPFPAFDGGEGGPNDVLGGTDGFVVGKDAPPEAVEFLEYLTAPEQAARAAATDTILPVTVGSEDAVTDPNQLMVLEGLLAADFAQLYLDQYYTPEIGSAVNDAVQSLFAGESGPEDATEAITSAAQG
jgi:raffinose/stachyose/melibiose transport system substrate-binding protein